MLNKKANYLHQRVMNCFNNILTRPASIRADDISRQIIVKYQNKSLKRKEVPTQ